MHEWLKSLLIWLFHSALILSIFHLLVPPLIHAHTRNRWTKLPLLAMAGIGAGAFMAWLDYVPYLLVFLWLGFTRETLRDMEGTRFELDAKMRMNKPLFYGASYAYVVIACVSAWLFQLEIMPSSN